MRRGTLHRLSMSMPLTPTLSPQAGRGSAPSLPLQLDFHLNAVRDRRRCFPLLRSASHW